MNGTRKYGVAQPYDAPRVRLRMRRRIAAKILVRVSQDLRTIEAKDSQHRSL
jgi:hypothetical protein